MFGARPQTASNLSIATCLHEEFFSFCDYLYITATILIAFCPLEMKFNTILSSLYLPESVENTLIHLITCFSFRLIDRKQGLCLTNALCGK